jgi:hypothetical protein
VIGAAKKVLGDFKGEVPRNIDDLLTGAWGRAKDC